MCESNVALVSVSPFSCPTCVRGWSGRRLTGRSCRRSCAWSGRRARSWSARSPNWSSRWPSLAQWEATPLLLLLPPPDPPTPTPHPAQRPQRLAKSNCRPSGCLPSLPSFLSSSPAKCTDTKRSAQSWKERHVSSGWFEVVHYALLLLSVGLTFVFVIQWSFKKGGKKVFFFFLIFTPLSLNSI